LDDFVSQVSGVSALAEPARRALYLYVAAQPEAVSRDQAAEGVDLPRHTAKFHLDKLVEEGLLDTEFRRLSGRRGPGAGRPTKLYRRSARQVAVTLPQRHYDLAGQILACAVEAAAREGIPVLEAVQRAAADCGRRLGAGEQPGEGNESPLDDIAVTLAGHGYEPRELPVPCAGPGSHGPRVRNEPAPHHGHARRARPHGRAGQARPGSGTVLRDPDPTAGVDRSCLRRPSSGAAIHASGRGGKVVKPVGRDRLIQHRAVALPVIDQLLECSQHDGGRVDTEVST
jgi:predicted ArsR family transcriptional regulator